MQAELLLLSMSLSMISEWIKTNRNKIDTLSPEEFKTLTNNLSQHRKNMLKTMKEI